MNKSIYCCIVLTLLCLSSLQAQTITPDIYAWFLNSSGITGYGGLPANVQQVRYSSGYVYVSCSDIPAYSIGPWPGNPNVASNQGFTFKIPRVPQVNNGTKTATALGHIGVLANGVSIFNAKDAMSYNNQNIWHQNAVIVEAPSFDTCLGHPQMTGEYHHHQTPRCLVPAGSSAHSPLLGYAFDGYPLYGPYAYADTGGTGAIVRMRSSYRKRNISTRTTLADGTVLSPSQYGPPVSGTYPLGYYVEDFEYVSGLGDLDQYNGRFCVTPEYPAGIYAYFSTIDSLGNSEYPYLIGPSYYGVVTAGNTGPGSGHVTISEPVTSFIGVAAYDASDTTDENVSKDIALSVQHSASLTVTYAIIAPPAHGSLWGSAPTLSYLPDLDFFGSDSFRFSATVPGGASDSATVYLTILQVNDSTGYKFQVDGDWNMISVPVVPDDPDKQTLFPSASSAAFEYQTTYVASETLKPGTGYWIKFAHPQTVTLQGTTLTSDTIDIGVGWNLIGTIGTALPVSSIGSDPPGIVTSPFFGYQHAYVESDTLKPGNAYWIKTANAGTLYLGSMNTPSSRIRIVPTKELPPPRELLLPRERN